MDGMFSVEGDAGLGGLSDVVSHRRRWLDDDVGGEVGKEFDGVLVKVGGLGAGGKPKGVGGWVSLGHMEVGCDGFNVANGEELAQFVSWEVGSDSVMCNLLEGCVAVV